MIVDLLPTEEQAAIRDSVSAVLRKKLPVSRLHDPDSAFGAAEHALWPTLAEMGLFGLGVPETRGGIGYSLAEEVTVARELGKHLVSPTVLSTMLAAHVAKGDLFDGIMAGEIRVAFANPFGPIDLSGSEQTYQIIDVLDAASVLVWNETDALLCRRPEQLTEVDCIDDTVGLARATLSLKDRLNVLKGSEMARFASLILSAYLAGSAEATLSMAVEYGKVREQFNQPIGSFQAIKHYCADMARRAEAAVAQTFFATLDALAREDDGMFEAAAARLLAREAALTNARFNIQIHGGMGYTYESDAHFYLKRAWLCSSIGSSARLEQQRLVAS